MKLKYSKGYKYKTEADFSIQLKFIRGYSVSTEYCTLDENGYLTVFKGYAWDGASGPTKDSNQTKRASLVHDVLAQLMREGHLPFKLWALSEKEMESILKEDGMWKLRIWYWMKGLASVKGKYAKPDSSRKIYTAP